MDLSGVRNLYNGFLFAFLWRNIARMLTCIPINLRSRVVNCCLDEASLFSSPLSEVSITVLIACFPVYYNFVTGKHMELHHTCETSPHSKVSILYFQAQSLCSSALWLLFGTVTREGPDPERICLGPPVVCELLTSCRKDFTTGVQVTRRMHLLKLQ